MDIARCRDCEQEKPFSEFSPDSSRRLGVSSRCKPCASAWQTARYHRLNPNARTIPQHGHGGRNRTPTYYSWSAMVKRCTNPAAKDYPDYGGRGITVCERWRAFPAFLADMGERPTKTSLDRIDVNGNYEPGNCRWATAIEQRANRRDKGRRRDRSVVLHPRRGDVST